DRNYGVGSDGILLLTSTARADFGLRIFNPDGSEAEKSGNGLRIFAKYLWDHGYAKQPTFAVDSPGVLVECQLAVRAGRVNFCAGSTLASGSSSCGAASPAVKTGRCDHGRVRVRMPGGELAIHVRPDWSLRLEGPVEEVCTGTLAREFVEAYVTGEPLNP